jgi:tetratricopeptide (TPR) repeat protein
VATPTGYRPLFAIGAGIFFASTATGLAFALVTEREIPRVEIEERLPSSLEDHRRYAAIKPRNPIALLLLGNALVEAGEIPEAVRVFERALASKAAPAALHERLAFLYWRQGRLEMARRQARIAERKGVAVDERLLKALHLSRREP